MRAAFVVCPSYHGATLLALLLNNHSQVTALGDSVPSRAFDQICACGRNVSECPFWKEVSAELEVDRFSSLKTLLPVVPPPLREHQLEDEYLRISGNRRLNRAAGASVGRVLDTVLPVYWRLRPRRVREYVETYRSFYGAVERLHGTSIFVDGSKSARKVELLARELGANARVIHLVRDPRGFAVSWRKNTGDPDMAAAAATWSSAHARLTALDRKLPYLRLRYEDLCRDPARAMRSVFEFLSVPDEDVVAPPLYPEKHHLMGNAMLFRFDGQVVLDERWRDELSDAETAAVLKAAGGRAAELGYR